MKYKALIFDLDGTAIPNRSDGMPSNRLINVVSQLKQKMKVCAATGRPFFNSKHILKALGILDPCIISGGAQIIDPVTEKTLWEKLLSMDQVQQIMQKVSSYEYPVFFSDDKKKRTCKQKNCHRSGKDCLYRRSRKRGLRHNN